MRDRIANLEADGVLRAILQEAGTVAVIDARASAVRPPSGCRRGAGASWLCRRGRSRSGLPHVHGCLQPRTLPSVGSARIRVGVDRLIRDCRGELLRLTGERLRHIMTQHPELAAGGVQAIEEALVRPDTVLVTRAAPDDRLYYRLRRGTPIGDKFLCVVVKSQGGFVVTAYMTSRPKKGVRVWPRTS